MYAAPSIVLEVPSVEQCSLKNAVAYMIFPSQLDLEVVDSPPVLPIIHDVHNVDLETKSEWDYMDSTVW